MNDIHEAYQNLGLTAESSRTELENRYRSIVRRMRAGELRGFVTTIEEAQMRTATRAYRFILEEETKKRSAAFRQQRYGKYKRYAGLAEQVDEFLFRHNALLILVTLLLLIFAACIWEGIHLQRERAAFAAMPAVDLSLVLTGELQGSEAGFSPETIKRLLLDQFPGWNRIDVGVIPASHPSLFTAIPDLYLVDHKSFIRLLQLGYLAKLDEWDTYGIDLSDGPLGEMIPLGHKPLIAAVGMTAEHRGEAVSFIRHFMNQERMLSDAYLRS